MGLSADTLSYDFDEEGLGFGKPQVHEATDSDGPGAAQKAALAVMSLGLLSLISTGLRRSSGGQLARIGVILRSVGGGREFRVLATAPAALPASTRVG